MFNKTEQRHIKKVLTSNINDLERAVHYSKQRTPIDEKHIAKLEAKIARSRSIIGKLPIENEADPLK